jgi:uncharacterized protein (TIGR02265 family)
MAATIAALPSGATCLGLYFSDVLDLAKKMRPGSDLTDLAGVPKRRYLPFLSYPYADVLRLIAAAARALYPKLTLGEGMRRVGHSAYERLFGTRVGAVVFGALGRDPARVLLAGPRGYGLSMNFGSVTAESVGSGRVIYRFREMPALLETHQVGVLEGALLQMGVEGSVLIDVLDLANADVEVSWTT